MPAWIQKFFGKPLFDNLIHEGGPCSRYRAKRAAKYYVTFTMEEDWIEPTATDDECEFGDGPTTSPPPSVSPGGEDRIWHDAHGCVKALSGPPKVTVKLD
eukprot:4961205-Pyramimonas_sp.AAC.1